MADARAVTFHVEVASDTTHFQIRFSADAEATWTGYDPASASPSQPADLAIALLDSASDYLLDGLNAGSGNTVSASYAVNVYQLRLKSAGGYGNWSDPFNIAGYPTAADLRTFLESTGLTITTALAARFPQAVSAARRDFESRTGRRFLAGPSETRRFDPPDGPHGLLFIGDAVSVSAVSYQPENATATAYEAGSDYWLEPVNAPLLEDPQPYTKLRTARRWSPPLTGTLRQALYITARWGYATSVPADVSEAILARAAAGLLPTHRLAAGSGRALKRWTNVDGISQEYDTGVWDALAGGWQAQYDATVQRYRKLSI